MNTTPQEPFYIDLKKKRETQGIEISEISEQTKINPKYFIEFEKGNFEVLPQVYTRLFLRSYAIEIGADPLEILENYEIHTTGKIRPKIEFKFSPNMDNTRETNQKTSDEGSFFDDDNLFKDINLKKIFGVAVAIFMLIFIVSKLRNLTAETTADTDVNNTSKEQIETSKNSSKSKDKIHHKSNLPGSYLDGFSFLDRKTISLGISPPYTLNVVSTLHSTIKIKIIENGITTLDKELDLNPAKPLERESKGKLHFELNNIDGITVTLNGNDKIISQFLKPENISNNKLAIRVILEEDGSLTAEYFQAN